MQNFASGLMLSCLLLLAGCVTAPPSPAPQPIKLGCPAVTPCTLSATQPQSNGKLLNDTDVIEADWASCAAQVDMVYQYQEQQHVQTQQPQAAPDHQRSQAAPDP
ncbi:Rz1-like lysis system protein LysC [Pseudomonas sp. NyZ704]|nr:Rz1-like lysis system protein LysC [Pseudomonas sp. NyZ704]